MTETEYIIATNRVKVSAALALLRDVMPESGYGVDPDAMKGVIASLRETEEKLFSLIELSHPPEDKPIMIKNIKEVLKGIDKEEINDDGGWWETSEGAAFGERKLAEVISEIESY